MTTKKKADRATAVPTERMGKKKEKIENGRKQIAAMKGSTNYGQATDVKAKVDDWTTVIDAWEANDKQIANLEQQIVTLQANDAVFARRWDTKKRAVFSAVTDFADGSIDTVKSFGCGVFGRDPLPPAGAPQNLRDKHSREQGTAAVEWDTMNGKFEFMVQHAADPANAATYVDPVTCSKASFKLTGQTRGATIYFRALTLDAKLPNGKSDWTPWVSVVVA